MPKKSSKENKNAFFEIREKLNLTREKASEKLGIAADRMQAEKKDGLKNLKRTKVIFYRR